VAGIGRALAGLAVMLATATASLGASAIKGDTAVYIWSLGIIPFSWSASPWRSPASGRGSAPARRTW
jgi:hypothetical protein